MEIHWIRCKCYEDAKNYCDVVYLHEWNNKPFYWGICNISVFGGNTRMLDGRKRNPRYGVSYRHWIEGCLRHGGQLYIGIPSERIDYDLTDIELTLIALYPSEMNVDENARVIVHDIKHSGDIPSSIKSSYG